MKESLSHLQTIRPLAERFTSDQIQILSEFLTVATYPKNSFLMKEGDPAKDLMFLLSGKAKVSSNETVLASIEPIAFFGESMFTEGKSRIADIVATENCQVITLSHDAFSKMREAHPKEAQLFSDFFTSALSEKSSSKNHYLNRASMWGDDLSAWLNSGAPLRG